MRNLRKLFAFLSAALCMCVANATSYWSTAGIVQTINTNLYAGGSAGVNWFTVTGVSSLGSCGTTTIGGTTYVQFVVYDSAIASASTVQGAIAYAYGASNILERVEFSQGSGTNVSVHVDDSSKDSNGNCYVKDIQ